jgi:hypothetical protein
MARKESVRCIASKLDGKQCKSWTYNEVFCRDHKCQFPDCESRGWNNSGVILPLCNWHTNMTYEDIRQEILARGLRELQPYRS